MKLRVLNSDIYYEIQGSGKPILFIHGYYPDHRLMKGCFEPVFSKIDGWKRIYFDLPGMGKTEQNPRVRNADEMLDVICGFIEKTIGEDDFLVAGESYGGYLARGVLNKLFNRVKGIFLLCPVVFPEYSKRNCPEFSKLFIDKAISISGKEKAYSEFKNMAIIETQSIWERYFRDIESGVSIADFGFLKKFQKTGYSFSFDPDDFPGTFNYPSCFLFGKQDHIVGYKDFWQFYDKYPRATYAVLDAAGHNLQIESAQIFEGFVKNWIQRVRNIF